MKVQNIILYDMSVICNISIFCRIELKILRIIFFLINLHPKSKTIDL